MSENTKIEWTDHTFNPWWGCQKVGPGCDHCYAETLDKRTGGQHWGPGSERRRTSVKNWGDPVRWNKQAFWTCEECGKRGSDKDLALTKGQPCHHEMRTPARQRVFCSSMADVFDNAVDPQWRTDLFKLIRATPNLDWLLLTKRIGNAHEMMVDSIEHELDMGTDPAFDFIPWPNVWIGATIVNQEEADRDIPKLLAVPAARRFLSMEPLLGPVDLGLCDCDKGSRPGPSGVGGVACPRCNGAGGRMLDWVIVGGESGPDARPMSIQWARELRDQCAEAGVPFLFKQWGEWMPAKVRPSEMPGKFAFGDYQHERTRFVQTCFYPRAFTAFGARCIVEKVGKKAAGRQLDGRTWDGYPL